MELTRWKLIAGGAALAGVVAGGVAAADTNGLALNDRRDPLVLGQTPSSAVKAQTTPTVPTPTTAVTVDVSPETADSPTESVADSVDPSPETADSPLDSAQDSPAYVPPPAPPAPAPAPAPGGDSYDSPVSVDSPDGGDS
jgi:hypothetical protein